jgi:hypothetical protein
MRREDYLHLAEAGKRNLAKKHRKPKRSKRLNNMKSKKQTGAGALCVSTVKDNLQCLGMLCRASKNKRRRGQVIDSFTDKEVKVLREIAQNFLDSNIPFDPAELKKLGKHKRAIRQFAYEKKPTEARETVKQRGGFLSVILPLLGSLVAPVMGSWVEENILKQ